MLANYLKVGSRNILRHKTISLINIFGLAAAMSVCMLIIMLIAVIISIPVAYFLNNIWLRFFVSRVSITPEILLMNVLVLTSLCFLVVFSQAWKAGTASVAGSLKSE